MAEQPQASQLLIELLDRLQLAAPGQVQSVAPLVTRLARDLPQFDSVWVDALAQARVLTPFQAAQINAGRGAELQTGPYVLRSELPGPGYARCFAAVGMAKQQLARLLIVPRTERPLDEVASELAPLVESSRLMTHPGLAAVHDAGIDGQRVWAACRPVDGSPAARWMVENGRLPGAAVLHIARQMIAALTELHQLEIVHGDLSALSLLLTENGRITLSHPGLRGIVRPAEGYAYTDLPPEAYDTIAPERISLAAKPSIATDIYACGCLWWHLTTGRAPFAGGHTIAKLRAVHSAKTIDVERLAPDVPPALANAIRASMAPDLGQRAASMRELSEILGPAGRGATTAVRRLLQQPRGPRQLWGPPIRRRNSLLARFGNATAAAACLGLLLGASVGWRYRHQAAWWPRWGAVEAKHERQDAKGDRTGSLARKPATPDAGDALHEMNAPVAMPPAKTDLGSVVPVSHNEPVVPRGPTQIEPRLLPCDRPQRIARLELRSGQTVRGAEGGRPLVYVPAQGLVVQGENVSFENIDFVWDAPAMMSEDAQEAPAILRLSAERVEFRGCSFQDVRGPSGRNAADWRPAAIDWSCDLRPPGHRGASLGGEIVCDNCVFAGVDAAIECRPNRVPVIEIRQTLHLRSGPLVRLDAMPASDQACLLSLFNTTVRASAAVLECRVDSVSRDRRNATGRISVSAVDSVLALDSTAALILFSGAEPPEALLNQLDWTGQGSLVTPTAVMSAWQSDRESLPCPIAEDRVQVAGLVRSQVEFAADENAGSAAAHIRRWQAPLRSNQPPGAGPGRLMLPKVGLMGR